MSSDELRKLLDLFRKIGDVDPVYPRSENFNYILLNGSTVPNMRERISFLADLVLSGKVKFKPDTEIVFLEGERPLFESENENVLTNPFPLRLRPGWVRPSTLPKDEREAAVLVWDQLDLPKELRMRTPLFIHAEKKPGSRRAETEDCVIKWIKKFNPKSGNALVVSSNPFVYYQVLITENLFAHSGSKGIKFEGTGSSAISRKSPTTKEGMIVELGIMLDNLARVLYYYSKK